MNEELKTVVWQCIECDKKAPCRIEITYNDDELPSHLKKNDRFRERRCLCKESRYPQWEKIETPSPWITIKSDGSNLPEKLKDSLTSDFVVVTDGKDKTWAYYDWSFMVWRTTNTPYDSDMGTIIAYQSIDLPKE